MAEFYVSIDIEADGPIPGPHSMLSLGAVAFDQKGQVMGKFSRNLFTLEGAEGHPDTMKWWSTQPEAWAVCRKDLRDPKEVMTDFANWVSGFPGSPVAIGFPVAYDFMFVYWYLMRFVGKSPFSHSALDMKTVAWLKLGGDYRKATKRNFPKGWFPADVQHNHIAVDDAWEQGQMFFNMLRASK